MLKLIMSLMFFGLLTPVRAQKLNYDGIKNIIQRNNVQSLEELLPLLPTEFRSHYTLIHTSKSAQGASDLNPRVIMFGIDASLTCSFNGEASQRGYDGLECIQYMPRTKSFDFRHIQFPTAQNGLQKVAFSQSGKTVDGKISCLGCHQKDPRPNWDEYPVWKGTYDTDGGFKAMKPSYYEFLKVRDSHPRYKWLVQGSWTEAPFYVGDSRMRVADPYYYRPDNALHTLFGKMNANRAARIMVANLDLWQLLLYSKVNAYYLACDYSPEQKQKIAQSGKKELPLKGNAYEEFVQKDLYKKGIQPNMLTTQFTPKAPGDYEFSTGRDGWDWSVSRAILNILSETRPNLKTLISAEINPLEDCRGEQYDWAIYDCQHRNARSNHLRSFASNANTCNLIMDLLVSDYTKN